MQRIYSKYVDMTNFAEQLEQLEARGRYRRLALPCGVDLTSNDYLGMAVHPALRDAAIEALEAGLDLGAAGSRLLRGHTQAHQALEAFAEKHFGAPGALFFSSGFQANYALLSGLAGRGDVIVYDSLVHASMREGIRASYAQSFKFAHNDMDALEGLLKRYRDQAQTLWIAVETLYSMDGDMAPLEDVFMLAREYGAILIADEAHAVGVYGEGGRGLCWPYIEVHGYARLVTLHTCGKALGVAGGLVCAGRDVIDYLVNTARPFIYTTAPMPLQAVLVQKSLEILVSEEGDLRRDRLFARCREALGLFGGAGTQIVPVILGDDGAALHAARALQEAGFDVRAIRPPTVPEGASRLRLSLSSELAPGVLQGVADVLKHLV
ncbi:MAG: 8-amino-7-oxononanoate synthase [Alphaproteobacteria bacterium]|nr:8-amino-7-oxononanoate synthase [Alphaproteobacteria bacterium]